MSLNISRLYPQVRCQRHGRSSGYHWLSNVCSEYLAFRPYQRTRIPWCIRGQVAQLTYSLATITSILTSGQRLGSLLDGFFYVSYLNRHPKEWSALVISFLVKIVGFSSHIPRYFSACFVLSWPHTHPLNIAWMLENTGSVGKHTIASGMIIAAANLCGSKFSKSYAHTSVSDVHICVVWGSQVRRRFQFSSFLDKRLICNTDIPSGW